MSKDVKLLHTYEIVYLITNSLLSWPFEEDPPLDPLPPDDPPPEDDPDEDGPPELPLPDDPEPLVDRAYAVS